MRKSKDNQTEMDAELVKASKSQKRKEFIKEALDWIIPYSVVLVIAVAFFLCFRLVEVSGISMDSTFSDGDVTLVNSIFYSEANRGDVVVIEATDTSVPLIKRVIAKGGDTIDIDFETGTVTVNNEVLSEDYIKEPTYLNEGAFEYPVTVPEGHYFVMGDNRNQSIDSRSPLVGFVPNEHIIGTVMINFGDIF